MLVCLITKYWRFLFKNLKRVKDNRNNDEDIFRMVFANRDRIRWFSGYTFFSRYLGFLSDFWRKINEKSWKDPEFSCLNPARIRWFSGLHVSFRKALFLQEKAAYPWRILTRSAKHPGQKRHRFSLGVDKHTHLQWRDLRHWTPTKIHRWHNSITFIQSTRCSQFTTFQFRFCWTSTFDRSLSLWIGTFLEKVFCSKWNKGKLKNRQSA